MTTTSPQAVADIVRSLMNGEGLPAADSPEFQRVTDAVGNLLTNGTAADRDRLGTLVLGLVIDSARSHIQTTQVLSNFGKDAF